MIVITHRQEEAARMVGSTLAQGGRVPSPPVTMGQVSTRETVWAIVKASSGNLVEWFDFYIYAFFSVYFAEQCCACTTTASTRPSTTRAAAHTASGRELAPTRRRLDFGHQEKEEAISFRREQVEVASSIAAARSARAAGR